MYEDYTRRLHEVATEMRELSERGEWGEEDEAKFERLNEAADEIEAKIALQARAGSLEKYTEPLPSVGERLNGELAPANEPTASEQYAEVFEQYIRYGREEMSSEDRAILNAGIDPEKRAGAQVKGTTTLGGYAVPDGAMQALVENQLTFGGLRRAPITILNTSDGREIPIPTDNDTGNTGVMIAEFTEETNTADVVVGQKLLNAYKFSSKFVKVSSEMIADANFDALNWVGGKIGTRLGRGLAPYLVNGDGTAEPLGLDTSTLAKTTASASVFTRAEILDLIHSIDPAYRNVPSFGLVFNDTTLKALRALTFASSDVRPLWVPSMRDGIPSTIEGEQYWVVTEVPDMAAGVRFMFAGDFSQFILRDAGPVRIYRLEERYREFDVTAFIGFSRHDSVIVDAGTAPIKHMRAPAS